MILFSIFNNNSGQRKWNYSLHLACSINRQTVDSKTVVDRYSAENLFRGAVCYFSSCRPTTLESTIGNFWEFSEIFATPLGGCFCRLLCYWMWTTKTSVYVIWLIQNLVKIYDEAFCFAKRFFLDAWHSSEYIPEVIWH